MLLWRGVQVLKCKHQQQVLQLQLHQTIQQRKAVSENLVQCSHLLLCRGSDKIRRHARKQASCGLTTSIMSSQAKQAEVMSVRQTGPLGSGLGGEALHQMDAGQTHTLGSGIALAAGDRSNSLQTTLSGGGAASRRMLAALSMNPGTTGSPSLSGQVGCQCGLDVNVC